jgi:hypothetical protein
MVKKNKIMTYVKAHNMDELHEMTTIVLLPICYLIVNNIICFSTTLTWVAWLCTKLMTMMV